jgi:hypothetical protein
LVGVLGGLCGFIPFFGLICLALFSSGESETEGWVYAIVGTYAAVYAFAIVASVLPVPHRRPILAGIAALTVAEAIGLVGEDASEALAVVLPAGALLSLAAWRSSAASNQSPS